MNSPSLEQLRAEYDKLKLLHQVSSVIHSTLESRQALELILSEAVRVMRASSGSVVLVNPTTGFLEIEASYGLPTESSGIKLKVGEGITGWVARTGKPALVADVTKDRRYVMVKRNVMSELAVPLEVNGELRGVLNVDSERLGAFSIADSELLRELAVQAAKVIHNTWLYEQLRVKARLFEALLSVGQTISSTLNLSDALQVITREACELMGGKMASLLMLDESGEYLDLKASHGAGEAYINKPRLSTAESVLGSVVRRKKPVQIENVQISSRYQNVSVAREEGLISLLSVPLMYYKEAIGALSVYTSDVHSFSNEEIRILSLLAEMSGIAIERARLYERIVNMEEQLRQNEKLSAIGLLAAEVAHEIRNPLTVMKMLYHSLNLEFSADDPRSRDVRLISEKMDHLNKIVEQVLDFARTAEPHFSSVDINSLMTDLMLLVRHKLTNQKITLQQEFEANLPMIQADPGQLEQAFLNLTLNAVESMPDGGKLTICTSIEQSAEGRLLRIDIRDTGAGMSPEQAARVFDSLLSTSKPKGTGLGLAIVVKIVEAHGGKITLKSREEEGSTFSIFLPVP
ncbi:MAG: GAF domain-containing protein [Verrucomicrobiota bacterium]|nr:GAF domain-containing protein [Verrucomicrobiota bacterium]